MISLTSIGAVASSAFVNPDPLAGILDLGRFEMPRDGASPCEFFKDVSCTIPATEEGDLVAAIRDPISGAIATQPTEASRPMMLIEGGVMELWYDGVDDSLTLSEDINPAFMVLCSRRDGGSLMRGICSPGGETCFVYFSGQWQSVLGTFDLNALGASAGYDIMFLQGAPGFTGYNGSFTSRTNGALGLYEYTIGAQNLAGEQSMNGAITFAGFGSLPLTEDQMETLSDYIASLQPD